MLFFKFSNRRKFSRKNTYFLFFSNILIKSFIRLTIYQNSIILFLVSHYKIKFHNVELKRGLKGEIYDIDSLFGEVFLELTNLNHQKNRTSTVLGCELRRWKSNCSCIIISKIYKKNYMIHLHFQIHKLFNLS